ncbi:uncharacterized protein RAG0_17311 [Rhynchosporium agropyri]|uniref:Uncharacterized protein n=1 Tax=Rhynchosporium agropyri TaxID=914238 RepID=A0A1E1LV82_9HELO|nr:uncharacterized protein RAG0_17311 [Rhynchosporium agropyri]
MDEIPNPFPEEPNMRCRNAPIRRVMLLYYPACKRHSDSGVVGDSSNSKAAVLIPLNIKRQALPAEPTSQLGEIRILLNVVIKSNAHALNEKSKQKLVRHLLICTKSYQKSSAKNLIEIVERVDKLAKLEFDK